MRVDAVASASTSTIQRCLPSASHRRPLRFGLPEPFARAYRSAPSDTAPATAPARSSAGSSLAGGLAEGWVGLGLSARFWAIPPPPLRLCSTWRFCCSSSQSGVVSTAVVGAGLAASLAASPTGSITLACSDIAEVCAALCPPEQMRSTQAYGAASTLECTAWLSLAAFCTRGKSQYPLAPGLSRLHNARAPRRRGPSRHSPALG